MITLQAGMHYIPLERASNSAYTVSENEDYGSSERNLDGLRFGEIVYKFLKRIIIKSIRDHQTGDWVCWSSDFNSAVKGVGETAISAQEDFEGQLHAVFQRLYRKRPFEMDKQEMLLWKQLANVIDVYHYRVTTPIVIREIGQISYGKISRPCRIKWLTGQNYFINPSKVPPELMSLKPGQFVEAEVKRDPLSHKEISIISVRAISFHLPNGKEAQRFWDSISIADLPNGSWE